MQASPAIKQGRAQAPASLNGLLHSGSLGSSAAGSASFFMDSSGTACLRLLLLTGLEYPLDQQGAFPGPSGPDPGDGPFRRNAPSGKALDTNGSRQSSSHLPPSRSFWVSTTRCPQFFQASRTMEPCNPPPAAFTYTQLCSLPVPWSRMVTPHGKTSRGGGACHGTNPAAPASRAPCRAGWN